jgi:hypothetical protein
MEPQITYEHPQQAPASDDASFANPFVLPQSVEQSQAIFGYLTADDVDVFAFNLTLADFFNPATGRFRPVIIAASALPPACNQTKNNYPVTALIGPGLPPPTEPLPFSVPPGMGVLVAPNPQVNGNAEREIFHDEAGLHISWFLPLGLSEECLFNGGCDFSNTISRAVFIPGPYMLAIWDPDGNPQDYTANIGFREDNTLPNLPVQDFVRDNAHLHTPCTEPYPGH